MQYLSKKIGKRIIVCFVTLFILMIASGMISSLGITRITNKFFSMYRDRLEPAMDISYIIEKMYQNRLLLEEHVTEIGPETFRQIEFDIYKNNNFIDSLINKYAETYLIPDEVRILNLYQNSIESYRKLETTIIGLSRDGLHEEALTLYTGESFNSFRKTIEPLESLEQTQLKEGKHLYYEAEAMAYRIKMSVYLCIGIAIIIAIIVGLIISLSYVNK